MIALRPSLGLLAAIAVAGTLPGCGGGSSSSPTGYTVPVTAPQSVTGVKVQPDKCPHMNGVSVRPCRVTLTASKPTATVTTKGPSGGHFTFRDNRCTKHKIASVTDKGSNQYLVTGGTAKGGCQVTFTDKDSDGNIIGRTELSVTNRP